MARMEVDGKFLDFPEITGSENEKAIDISKLRSESGYITLDDSFGNTGSCRSAITYIDGANGVLRYRGYSIEELAEKSSFIETAYLVIYGHLPNREEYDRFSDLLTAHEMLDEDYRKHYEGFPRKAHPMAILSGYMQRYTGVKTVGLCHSVQTCSKDLFEQLGMQDKLEGRRELIAGINHMAWLLEIKDKDNNDLYPEIKKRIDAKLNDPEFTNKVRLEYIKNFGYYCTESSEHNAEYNMFYIKSKYPELIERYNIPLDEYPRRCVEQIANWKKDYAEMLEKGVKEHNRSNEYASHIMESIVTNIPYQIGGNVLNEDRLITNLPKEACVEVPCLVNGRGIHPCHVGALPVQCAAMNMTNVNVQLLTIEAAKTLKKEHIYQAAMLDPHTASELDIDTIKKMVDDLIEAHGDYLPKYSC